jgi:hypothetical protein
MTENERFGFDFAKTGSINSGTSQFHTKMKGILKKCTTYGLYRLDFNFEKDNDLRGSPHYNNVQIIIKISDIEFDVGFFRCSETYEFFKTLYGQHCCKSSISFMLL